MDATGMHGAGEAREFAHDSTRRAFLIGCGQCVSVALRPAGKSRYIPGFAVEQGKAPEQIIASHVTGGKVDRARPLCPYPQVAKYKGSGSIDDAASFVCALP